MALVASQQHRLDTTHGHSDMLQGQMQCNGIQYIFKLESAKHDTFKYICRYNISQ